MSDIGPAHIADYGASESPPSEHEQLRESLVSERLLRDENERLKGALRYIASPTLGRPGDVDAAEFVRQGGGSEYAIRTALAYCITLAQQVLDPEHSGPEVIPWTEIGGAFIEITPEHSDGDADA